MSTSRISTSTSRDPISYILENNDISIADANYMSLYGATASADLTHDASMAEGKLSMYNLNNMANGSGEREMESVSRNKKSDGIMKGSYTQLNDNKATIDDDTASGITHQSYDEALYELKFRRKSTMENIGKSPIGCALFNMLAGCGVVGLPVTYRYCGLTTGITMMIVVAILSVYTLRLQVQTGKKVKCQDYERLVSKCFGVYGYYFISFSILIFDIGACLTYTIILGNSAKDVMSYLFDDNSVDDTDDGDQFWKSNRGRQIVIATIYTCMILPFCLGKNFEFIEKVSALAIFVVVLMIDVVMTEYYQEHRYNQNNITIEYWITDDYIAILAALGTISFAFIQHDLAFLVYKTLKNNTLKRYTILAFLGMAIQCILCVTMAVYGYLSFGENTNDDILTNYDIDNLFVLIVRIFYTFRMAFVFPTAFYVVRHICYAIIFRGYETYEHATRKKQIIFTIIPWSVFLTTGLFLDDLGFVMSLAGLLSALNIAFVLPCLCHLKVGTKYSIYFWTAPKGQKCAAFIDTFPSLILIVFGIIAGVTGSIGLVYEYVMA